jgi:hypothetical protein
VQSLLPLAGGHGGKALSGLRSQPKMYRTPPDVSVRQERLGDIGVGIDEVNRVAFIHIPKCAGTSIIEQLKSSENWQFNQGLEQHSDLGLISPSHVPLKFLESHFPGIFRKVCEYNSFALVRDPYERFASAVFEKIETFDKISRIRVTTDHALSEAHKVMSWLVDRENFCEAEYIHFSKQFHYVNLGDRRIVREIYPIEAIGQFCDKLNYIAGTNINPDIKLNINYAPPKGSLYSQLYRLRPLYKNFTTARFRQTIVKHFLLKKNSSRHPMYERFRDDPLLNAFVENYYKDDLILHASALDKFTAIKPIEYVDHRAAVVQ